LTPIIKSMQIHHNFVRPHTALDGKTPAEVAGIQILWGGILYFIFIFVKPISREAVFVTFIRTQVT